VIAGRNGTSMRQVAGARSRRDCLYAAGRAAASAWRRNQAYKINRSRATTPSRRTKNSATKWDCAEYGLGAQSSCDLGAKNHPLLTNNPKENRRGWQGYGLKIVEHGADSR